MFKAFFFDMDGVLVDSMRNHCRAWEQTMPAYNITFAPRDCYLNEGRTSKEVIRILAKRQGVELDESLLDSIYETKTRLYRQLGGATAMHGVADVLHYLREQDAQIWVVTGGGQPDLFEQLEGFFGTGIFRRDHMITAMDVTHGKPDPEPYLRAWERSGLPKEACCVVENAPLGCQAGHAAEIFTAGVISTSVLSAEDLSYAGADHVFADMEQFLNWLKQQ